MRHRPKLRLSTIKKYAPFIKTEEQLQRALAEVVNPAMRRKVEILLREHADIQELHPQRPHYAWHFTIDFRKAAWYGVVVDACCPWFRVMASYRYYEFALNAWRTGAGVRLRRWQWEKFWVKFPEEKLAGVAQAEERSLDKRERGVSTTSSGTSLGEVGHAVGSDL